MKRLEKVVLLTTFIERLHTGGSWCGETHIQKATYFLQELLKVPMDFKFILYKHGPFSFDLRNELTEMRADGILELEIKIPNYGSSLTITKQGKEIQGFYNNIITEYEKELGFIVEKLGSKNVIELEKLATALYITLKNPEEEKNSRATLMNTLKPHISVSEGISSVKNIDLLISESKSALI